MQEHPGVILEWYQRDIGGEAEARPCAHIYAEGVRGEYGTLPQLEPDHARRFRLQRMVRLPQRKSYPWSTGPTHAEYPLAAPAPIVHRWLRAIPPDAHAPQSVTGACPERLILQAIEHVLYLATFASTQPCL